MGVLEGEEGVWKQRQSFRRMKTNVSHFFLVTQELQQSTGFI